MKKEDFTKLAKARSVVRTNRVSSDMLSEVSRVINRLVSNSSFVLSSVVAAFIVLTHLEDVSDGPLGPFFEQHTDNKVVSWILSEFPKFLGAVVFVPSCMSVPKSLRSSVFVAELVGVLILPPLAIWTYLIASISVVLFINLRESSHKLIVFAVASFVLYNDYLKQRVTSRDDDNVIISSKMPVPEYVS